MTNFKVWISSFRLRTLPLSISGILLGSALAYSNQFFNTTIFVFALLTTISLQILSNLANDYGDGIRGTDDHRKGEERMVSSGAITPKQMKSAMIITTITTLVIALFLIYISFGKENFGYSVLFFLLGIASIIAAIKYTVGNSAYGYSGFGDVFVFVFFGLLSVAGSYFLYTKQLNFQIFLPAISVGLLSTAVLNLNNMRDQIEDKKSNKNTLVVKIGSAKAKIYHYLLIIGALISSVTYVQFNYHSLLQYLFLVAFIPLLIHITVVAKNIIFSELDNELKKVALSTFLFAILFVLGQFL
jgi:1,4-dihydroxy-2-naphthoate octaprenyltransferase